MMGGVVHGVLCDPAHVDSIAVDGRAARPLLHVEPGELVGQQRALFADARDGGVKVDRLAARR